MFLKVNFVQVNLRDEFFFLENERGSELRGNFLFLYSEFPILIITRQFAWLGSNRSQI